MAIVEPLLLTATRIQTFIGEQHLTNASGFFFARDQRLYLVTSRHVMFDEPSDHRPDSIQIELHTDANNMASSIGYSIPLYDGSQRNWRHAVDAAGDIDVAVIELEQNKLPTTMAYAAFTPAHLLPADATINIGIRLLVVGYPLGFHDTLHHIPVVRGGCLSSSYGLRFQGSGFFLTDARTHRGTSGAPVVMRTDKPRPELGELQCYLLGIHSSRLDLGTRDVELDEALALNCSWYADILMTLTED